MEISPVSNIIPQFNCTSGTSQTTSVENSSTFIYINNKEEDEENTIIMLSETNNLQGIASEFYRDSLGRPALGTYNANGTIQGTSTVLGSSLNIAC